MKHRDKNNIEINIGDTVHVPAIKGNVNFEFTGRVDSFNPTDDYVVVVDQEDNAFCVEPELLEIEGILETAEKVFRNIHGACHTDTHVSGVLGSFVAFWEQMNEQRGEVIVENENEGKDICYGCGKVQEYRTMRDVDESFAIYCDKCHPLAKILRELEEFKEMLQTNTAVDWDVMPAEDEFAILSENMGKIIKKLRKTLESTR